MTPGDNNDKKSVDNTTAICQNAGAEEVSGLHDAKNEKSTENDSTKSTENATVYCQHKNNGLQDASEINDIRRMIQQVEAEIHGY